jgi:hypothetical protein
MKNRSLAKAVLTGGTLGAALDLMFATSFAGFHGLPPAHLLRLIASGLLGAPALEGGASIAALGFALHFLMSWLWAGLFAAAAARVRLLTAQPVLAGCAFGVVVFLCMRLIVKPLSAFPYPVNWAPLASSLDLLSHMLLFGVPIALACARAHRGSLMFSSRRRYGH